jgi:hypothetical protein
MRMKMCDCRHEGIANTTCINLVKRILCFDNVKQISTVHVFQNDMIALCITVGIMDGCRCEEEKWNVDVVIG